MIPVSIVTGFLGSGKTTLIGRVLRDPGFARTAVIVNEFGEIGLDHDLIAASTENLLALTTGCLCCAVRGDLVATLSDLAERQGREEVRFDRVLIETSGMADPAPILQALMTDRDVAAIYETGAIVTVVDSLLGETTLDRHVEARRQAALADVLLLSKTDISGAPSGLRDRLWAMNPGALLCDAEQFRAADVFTSGNTARQLARLEALAPPPAASPFGRGAHTGGISSFTLQRSRPVPALALTLLLEALAEHCGAKLLRLKGLVDIAEMPGKPAVIHGVQHVVAAPVFLDDWPSTDHTTRIVFIASGVPPHLPVRLLDAIEEEVLEETERWS
jgi:G3E family GTPase